MMKSRFTMFVTLIAVLLVGALVMPVNAQEPPATTTLEEVTADSASFYGSEVTIEGLVETFLNVNMFVLSEGAALDDDRVLVINNSGQPFPADVVVGAHVLVTGVIHPSRGEYHEGGMTVETTPEGAIPPTVDPNLITTPDTAMEATPDAAMEPTAEGAEMATPDPALATPDTAMEPTVDTSMVTPDTAMEPTVEGAEMVTPDAAMATPDTAMEPTMDTSMVTPETMATPAGDTGMTPQIDALSFFYTYPQDHLDGYNDYTILVVTGVQAVTIQPDTE
ncbi:MAG: hypothetical protein IT320_23070 [Anaerolineae bacterium]|nr:hypothetical protein [Anaerolineae bacterium]